MQAGFAEPDALEPVPRQHVGYVNMPDQHVVAALRAAEPVAEVGSVVAAVDSRGYKDTFSIHRPR